MMAPTLSTPPDPSPTCETTDVRTQQWIIWSILCDIIEVDGIDELGNWIDHVGFDLTALRDPSDLMAAWLGHYRRGRRYDVDRALNDLLTWPPTANRLASPNARQAKRSMPSAGETTARSVC